MNCIFGPENPKTVSSMGNIRVMEDSLGFRCSGDKLETTNYLGFSVRGFRKRRFQIHGRAFCIVFLVTINQHAVCVREILRALHQPLPGPQK